MALPVGIVCNEVWGGNRATTAALNLPGLRGSVFALPHENAASGGDVHYVSSCGTGRVTRVILADVSGHGTDASDMAVVLRSLMRRYLNHIAPQELAGEVNANLLDSGASDGRFATAVIVTYFAPIGELTLCNAGHPPPMIHRQRASAWQSLNQAVPEKGVINLPLGIEKDSGYQALECRLNPGDVLLLYTDALTEATDREEALLGGGGLIAILNELGVPEELENPDEFTARLIERIESHGYRFDDDITAVILECTGHTGGADWPTRRAGAWLAIKSLFRGEPFPWPELSLRNIGGAVVPTLNRVGRRDGAK